MIIWLEDRRSTSKAFEQVLRESRMPYFLVGTIGEVTALLDDEPELAGLTFIIDIMLHGVNDLQSIGVPNASTSSGNRAGQVFVDRYLRSRDSRFRAYPVMFLTERIIDDELLAEIDALRAKAGSGPVGIMQKYSESDLNGFIPALQEFQTYTPPPLPSGHAHGN